MFRAESAQIGDLMLQKLSTSDRCDHRQFKGPVPKTRELNAGSLSHPCVGWDQRQGLNPMEIKAKESRGTVLNM